MDNNAQYFVDRIGLGVAEAFKTCCFFLGVETEAFENADIHPEYVTTVEVAKKLTGIDRYVSLETHMKDLRHQARGLARMLNLGDREKHKQIADVLAEFKFGGKDSCRIDVVVRSSDPQHPPLLLAEAKLGVGNVQGIIRDIDRVLRLLAMYDRLELLDLHPVYGAVLFHSSREGGNEDAANVAAEGLLATVEAYLSLIKDKNKKLHAKAGLLSSHMSHSPVQGYWEQYTEDEGDGEFVFAKKSFTFAPGLVLLSHRADVDDVNF